MRAPAERKCPTRLLVCWAGSWIYQEYYQQLVMRESWRKEMHVATFNNKQQQCPAYWRM